jgi:hypothetical protein
MLRRIERAKGLVAVLVLLHATACAPAATPTPTPMPATPTPEPVWATSAEDIQGTWLGQARDAVYQRFAAGGVHTVAVALEDLDATPDVEGTYQFEGTTLTMTLVGATGLPACEPKSATYRVQLLPDGNIRFAVLEDRCAHRRRSTAQLHVRVP